LLASLSHVGRLSCGLSFLSVTLSLETSYRTFALSVSKTSALELLEQLSLVLGTPVSPDMVRFCEVFQKELAHFSEVGIRLNPPGLVTMTLGPGSRFGEAVGCFLRDELHFEDDVVDEVLGLQRSIDDWMLVRFLSEPLGEAELGLYFRRTMSVARAIEWLAARGVSSGERAALAHLGRLLGASRTGVLAARMARDAPTLYKVYLHAPSTEGRSSCKALEPVFEYFQFPKKMWKPLVSGLDAMGSRGPGDLFVSLTLGDGDQIQAIKLDIFQVNLHALEGVLRSAGLLSQEGLSPVNIATELGLATAEHCGIALTPTSCTLTAYFVNRS